LFNDLRTKAKTVGFGLAYGKGAESYAKEFGISVTEAQEMIDSYFRLYKQTYEWRKRIMEQATTKGILKLHSGRRRRFTMAVNWINSEQGKKSWSGKIVKESIMRMAVNFPIQGNAHETFERGCLRLVRAFRKHGLTARIMLSIHDGIVGECLASEKDMVEKLIHETMPELFNIGTKYELGTAYDVGFYEDRWYGKEIA
jgi:DNA polymerase-1